MSLFFVHNNSKNFNVLAISLTFFKGSDTVYRDVVVFKKMQPHSNPITVTHLSMLLIFFYLLHFTDDVVGKNSGVVSFGA